MNAKLCLLAAITVAGCLVQFPPRQGGDAGPEDSAGGTLTGFTGGGGREPGGAGASAGSPPAGGASGWEVESLFLQPGFFHLEVGESADLFALALDKGGRRRDVSAQARVLVEDPAILEVSEAAVSPRRLTGLSEGFTRLHATYQGVASPTMLVQVVAAAPTFPPTQPPAGGHDLGPAGDAAAGDATAPADAAAPPADAATQPADAATPPDAGPPPPPPCGGAVVGGACWYASPANGSCDDACLAHGGCDLAATRDFAGSGGTDEGCVAVLAALGYGGFPHQNWSNNDLGCQFAWDSWTYWSVEFPTTCGAAATGSQANAVRMCACRG